jgi:hypothetical protein
MPHPSLKTTMREALRNNPLTVFDGPTWRVAPSASSLECCLSVDVRSLLEACEQSSLKRCLEHEKARTQFLPTLTVILEFNGRVVEHVMPSTSRGVCCYQLANTDQKV